MPQPTSSPRELALSGLPDAELIISAPGRVNLLGEHVDYNMGVVLPAAIDKRLWLAVKPIEEPVLQVTSLDLNEQVNIALKDVVTRVDEKGNPLPQWSLYPAAVAWVMLSKGYSIQGMQAVIASDLPMRAGLSSSAAIEVAFALAFQTIGGIEMNRMQLAQLCQLAENRYIGVQCGLMDQFAVSHGVARHALFFDTRSLEWQPIPLPADTVLVIADSGRTRELAHSAYNQRQQECQLAVQYIHRKNSNVHSLRDVTKQELAGFLDLLPEVVARRTHHVVDEIDRVERSALALVEDDAAAFGAFMLEGHASLRDLYDVSCDELDYLVEAASNHIGCLGARLTGAGFGGCTINLVQKQHAQDFCEKLQTAYQERFLVELKTYICHADRGAFVERMRKAVL
ncbi:MAG TPA: galactokinase [Anaerolineaceae bacterium]|uniref:Galactokinase n=1 Tax=Anaerolinea thermophila TaxID=167964 RepID=A0A124FN12_9CHLR|nr:MAG: Galactokinase [Anaerolinea thermophila]HAF61121.1 galactokinase [Anaerolineaceae bacterium]